VKDAPQLRSAVLDSPFPPSVYQLSELPRNDHDLVLQLFEECQQDPDCDSAYPNLKQRLAHLLDSLAEKPLSADGQTVTQHDLVATLVNLSGTRAAYVPKMIDELEQGVLNTYLGLKNGELGMEEPENETSLDLNDPVQAFIADAIPIVAKNDSQSAMFQLIGAVGLAVTEDDPIAALTEYIETTYDGDTRDQLLELLSKLTPEDIAKSPQVIQMKAEAAAPEKSAEQQAAEDLASKRLFAVLDVAHFLNKNIHCNEDTQFRRYEDAINTYNDLAFPQFANLDYLREQAHICDNWPVQAAPIEVKNPMSSTVPTLILQGGYDRKTPVFMGQRLSRELENSVLVIVPQQGHEIWTKATNCAGQIATAFIENPDQKPDLSCLDARRPQWALPEDEATAK